MAELSVLHRLSRLLVRLLHPLFPPDPTPSTPDLPQEDRTPSNLAPLQEGPTPSNPNPVVIGNDLIREILKFLPVKSLMRFKCVSKDWLCIITDPSFTTSYPGGFRGPIVFKYKWITDAYEMIYYLNIDDTGPTGTCEAYYHSTVHRGKELVHTGVVNGLICFYNGNKSWLYNIATRERLHLPVSGPVPAGDAQRYSSTYRLGFDPVSKLYKLLKISSIFDFPRRFTSMYTEILTIGVDSSWRIIDSLQPPEPLPLSAKGLCVHGVIYAMEFYGIRNCFLNAFRVAEERFQSVPLPPDFDHNEEYLGRIALLRFSPGLALVSCGARPETVNIDRYSYNEVGRESQGTWDHSEILTLPEKYLFPEGICPNGKVLMHDGSACDLPRLFLYNPIQKEFEKLVVTNWDMGGYSGPHCDSYYNEENIVSLKYLTSSGT